MLEKALTATGMGGGALLLLLLLTLLAAVLRGYAGFGFSALVVASASLFLPTREVVPLVLIMEVFGSILMARQVWGDINWRLVGFVLLGVVCFSPLGQFALSQMDINQMRLIAGLLLLLAIALLAAGRFFTMPNAPAGWVGTGVATGFMNGLLAMGGITMMVCLMNSGMRVAVLRASLVGLFFLIDSYAIGVAAVVGLVDAQTIARTMFMAPFMLAGIFLGARKFDPEQEQAYRKVVLALLAVLAVLLLLRALVG